MPENFSTYKVSLVKCRDYETDTVEKAVKEAVDLLGGIENFVRPNELVLLKPNLLSDVPPEKGVDTHPEIVRAVIRLVKPLTRNIICGDSPSVWGEKKDVDRVYEISGMKKVCDEEGVKLVYFNNPVIKNGYPLTDWAFKCDRLINIPKFKTHGYTVITACLKNLFGLVVGMHKMEIHKKCPKGELLSKAIVDIYQSRKPDLNILDGVIAMEGQGPGSSGNLKKMQLVSASADGLSMDMVCAALMKIDVFSALTTKEAVSRGFKPQRLSEIQVLGGSIADFQADKFIMPKTCVVARLPMWFIKIILKLLTSRPCIDNDKCRSCGLCLKSCPVSAVYINEKGFSIDKDKCILCLCCQEICPNAAVFIKKSLLSKIVTR
ncbi:MAG TPA: DUF362 domain-containing protein [Candidatus Omnitrophota bacterium]|nr:DUF362 domain-containing protein [Candidatus Omnitrophota bacterium]